MVSRVSIELWRDGDHEYHGEGETEEAAWLDLWSEVGNDVTDLIENGSFPEWKDYSIKDKIRWWYSEDENSIFVYTDGKREELNHPFYYEIESDHHHGHKEEPNRFFREVMFKDEAPPSTLYVLLKADVGTEFVRVAHDLENVDGLIIVPFGWNGSEWEEK